MSFINDVTKFQINQPIAIISVSLLHYCHKISIAIIDCPSVVTITILKYFVELTANIEHILFLQAGASCL
jgi:hypothetical protein